MHTTENNRARRLLLDAQELGDGWLMAMDNQGMTDQLRALFFGDSFDDLMAARIPMFLGQKLTGQDGKRMTVDQAEDAGLLLADGDAVPPIRRLRGIRLDALRGLAQWCNADDIVRMIDGVIPEQASLQPAPASSEQDATESGPANQSDRPTVAADDCLPPVATGELAAAFAGFKGWNEGTWCARLGAASSKQWLLRARLSPGTKGRNGAPATWNPVILAMELYKMAPSTGRIILARFQTKPVLKPWLDQLVDAIPNLTETI